MTRYIACILAIIILAGCSAERTISFEVSPKPYLVMEYGVRKNMWIVLIKREAVGGGEKVTATYPFLAQSAPRTMAEASRLWEALPPKYLLARTSTPNLISAILGVTSSATKPGEGPLQPVRWIISVDPLIVGIGRKIETPRDQVPGEYSKSDIELDSTCRLINKTDLGELVDALVIVDHWPQKWPEFTYGGRSESWDAVIGAALRPGTKRIPQPAETTIEKVFQGASQTGALP